MSAYPLGFSCTPWGQTVAHWPHALQAADRTIRYFPMAFRYRSGAGRTTHGTDCPVSVWASTPFTGAAALLGTDAAQGREPIALLTDEVTERLHFDVFSEDCPTHFTA